MNPTFTIESTEPKAPVQRFVWLKRILRVLARLLLTSPFKPKPQFRNEEGTRLSRIVRGITYRLAFAPVILVVFLVALVFATTHPGQAPESSDPSSFGVYYDPVNFVSDDGARLDAWLIPVLDAKRVLAEKEEAVNRRYPAVLLVHDFAGSRQQLLPMVQPLHQAGFVVLAMNLRGGGAAQTFGIKEATDIKAAVEMLRRRAYVDPSRIAVVGIGTGANAALIAARNDTAIAAVVVAAPVDGFDRAFASRVGERAWLSPLRPLLRWTFQVMHGVDASELDLSNFTPLMQTRHVFMTDGRAGLMEPTPIRGVQLFLQKHLDGEVALVK